MAPEEQAKTESRFEAASRKEGASTLVGDTIGFLKNNKKWWLLPIVVMLVFASALVLLSGTAAAPFIYTLF